MTEQTDAVPIATAEQFKSALRAVRNRRGISDQELKMLRAQCRAPDHTISATRLAQETGLTNFRVANMQYGALAHDIADSFGYVPPKRSDGRPRWWLTLSLGRLGADEMEEEHFEWIMRPELVQALKEMKWA